MTYIVKISVRTLVEYVFRSGNIESGFRTSSTLTEGTKAHKKIQNTYNEEDQREVFLKTELDFENLQFHVEGRCDGLLINEDGTMTIDEIKSTSQPLEQITKETYPVHWAQATFYAYMYARDHGLSDMNIQLTYVQVNTEEQQKFHRSMTYQALESFVLHVVEQYAPYAMINLEHEEDFIRSANALLFPFESYRAGQRKLAGGVYKTILDGKNLFARAPTGIGKTISTIFPAVKAIGEGHLKRVFYLTAKTITRTMAEEAFSLLSAQGLDIKVVTITAKDKICLNEEINCSKEHCVFADGHYDRINDAVLDILANESLMPRNVIEGYARKHRVCPFEFSLDLAYAADAVICDYNYIFDPRVSLKRLFEEQKKATVLLIDEAHNLVDRAREMYSAELFKSNFLQIMREYKGKNSKVVKAAKAVNDHLLTKKKQSNSVERKLDEALVKRMETFIIYAEIELIQSVESNQGLLDAYFSAQTFVKIANLYDEERFVTYIEVNKNEIKFKLFCLDPSQLVQRLGNGYRSKIFFSATLTPADYYTNLLGGKPEDYIISVPSPFDRENAEVIIQPLSTRYRDREQSMKPMVRYLVDIIEKRPGNYLIFFPSYKYMHAVYEEFKIHAADVNTILQDTGMTEGEREDFLTAFQPDGTKSLVGFAVLGGIFSEGIDLRGERLLGVIVVGVGLPQICFERDIIKDHFTAIGRNGFDYAYVYPGMNKVLQAGGRLIRSESDQGTIVLIDDRFLQQKYQALLPYEWQHWGLFPHINVSQNSIE